MPSDRADFRRRLLSQVVDSVAFKVGPDDRDLIVYVGFDEGEAEGQGASAMD